MIRKLLKLFRIERKTGFSNRYTFIDKYTNIGNNYLLAGFPEAKITIGKYCDIAENFRIRPRNHSVKYANIQRQLNRENGFKDLSEYRGDVCIGNACWIGDNVLILAGVHVGNGAIIGGGSVVTKNVPSFSIVAGVPAKLLKYRFNRDVIEFLEQLRWWDWSTQKIKMNKEFFDMDLTKQDINKIKRSII